MEKSKEPNVGNQTQSKSENETNFNSFIEVLARIVQKYGHKVLEELDEEERIKGDENETKI